MYPSATFCFLKCQREPVFLSHVYYFRTNNQTPETLSGNLGETTCQPASNNSQNEIPPSSASGQTNPCLSLAEAGHAFDVSTSLSLR